MRPSVRIHELVVHINYCAKQLGLDLLAPKLRFVFRTWITMFAPVSYLIFGVYWTFRETQQHWMDGLRASIMLGGLINGSIELLTLIQNHLLMRKMLNYTIEIFADYESRGADYCAALNFGVDRILKIRRIIRIGYVVSFLVMLAVPLLFLVYNGTRVTVIQYEIPGLSLENNFGYTLTYLQQMIVSVVGGIGFYMGDLLVLLALVQILTFAHILQIKANVLNDALNHKEQSRIEAQVGGYADNGIQSLLLDLIKWHQLFIAYCRDVENTYHNMIAAQVLSSAISILLCFCVSLNGFHMISTIYLFVSTYSMLVYCVYDQVYDSLCSISWQELRADQRKLFGLMLKEAQNTQTMTMIGILPLSMRTALQASVQDIASTTY
ncbi:putative odorant receptor 83c [Drosophila novamexicana]|uniref:putative odorant receptor 83c n=1 Tax=Drosophila novamexicana TaxID=47314 RepID=UPI0011E60045|nr:putative odorant receptor 83c [Drosophila novamexicana]